MTTQRDRTWVADASEPEVVAAFHAGELRVLLGRSPDAPVQRTEAWLQSSTPEQIAAAFDAGELIELQGGQVNELGNRVDQFGEVTS